MDSSKIEQLWDMVERKIRIQELQPINIKELEDAIIKAWTRIPKESFQYIIESMARRNEAVLKVKPGQSIMCHE